MDMIATIKARRKARPGFDTILKSEMTTGAIALISKASTRNLVDSSIWVGDSYMPPKILNHSMPKAVHLRPDGIDYEPDGWFYLGSREALRDTRSRQLRSQYNL